jgi:hypothetical protein
MNDSKNLYLNYNNIQKKQSLLGLCHVILAALCPVREQGASVDSCVSPNLQQIHIHIRSYGHSLAVFVLDPSRAVEVLRWLVSQAGRKSHRIMDRPNRQQSHPHAW